MHSLQARLNQPVVQSNHMFIAQTSQMPYGSNNLCNATILSRSPVSWNKIISFSFSNDLKMLNDPKPVIHLDLWRKLPKMGSIVEVNNYIKQERNVIKFPFSVISQTSLSKSNVNVFASIWCHHNRLVPYCNF